MLALVFIAIGLIAAPARAAEPSFPMKFIPGAVPEDRAPDGNTVIFEDEAGLIVVDTGRHLANNRTAIFGAIPRRGAKPY